MKNISFATSVWEKTYQTFLSPSGLRVQYDKIAYPFKTKLIIINNVEDKEGVKKLIQKNYPDFDYICVEDMEEEVLLYFEISKRELILDNAYWYTIQHLTRCYMSTTPYFFSLSEDCSMAGISNDWIDESIDIMEDADNIICAMPSWEKSMYGPSAEAVAQIGNFYLASGFTDQVCLGKTEVFKEPIYFFTHPDSERYPSYAGNCFEKRINSYMKTNHKYRLISKKEYYIHG